ncbi:MAG: hypothetical protein IKP95_00370 [Ruminococcus sp.]|nr:hypothetical protein [Ruminococcus sp.]
MANNGYLRTVRMGGFDKSDVLAYVDDLNSKIYNLENKVKDQEETIARLERSAGDVNADFEGKAELEKKVEEAKNKVAELMASTDTMKVQIADYEQVISEKEAELEKQKNEIEDLKEKLEQAEANAGSAPAAPAFDLGTVFIEAQNTANKIVSEAKKAAKNMTDEAEAQANQIIDDANAQAETTVTGAQAEATRTLETARSSAAAMTSTAKAEADAVTAKANNDAAEVTAKANSEAAATTAQAQAQAKKMIDDATAEAGIIRAKSADLRASVKNEYSTLSENITQVISSLNDLFGASIGSANKARDLIDDGLALVEEE